MKQTIITLCLLALATVSQAANYEVKTDVQGMVNINSNLTGGSYTAGVDVGTNPENAVTYTLEVLARPIKKGRPFLKRMDQIHYALAGLSTSTAMVTDQELPWVKTISGQGIMSANLIVTYDKTVDAVSHSKDFKKMKNTRIVLKISRGDKLLEKKVYEPSPQTPNAQITLTFGANNMVNVSTAGAEASIGSVEIDGQQVRTSQQAPAHHHRKHHQHSRNYTFEVLVKPIHEGRPYLQEVEYLSYWLSGLGIDTETLDDVKLPWRKTVDRDPESVESASLETGYRLSLDPFFNKEHAHLVKNSMVQLNIYNGDRLLVSKEYHPSKDNGDEKIEFKFEENK